jgi:hypothetical protein
MKGRFIDDILDLYFSESVKFFLFFNSLAETSIRLDSENLGELPKKSFFFSSNTLALASKSLEFLGSLLSSSFCLSDDFKEGWLRGLSMTNVLFLLSSSESNGSFFFLCYQIYN